MSKVITFSRAYPSYHPRKGEPTYFVEKIWEGLNRNQHTADDWRSWNVKQLEDAIPDCVNNYAGHNYIPKHHTIRSGHRWKEGDWFQPAVWGNNINPKSGRSGPYHSKQIKFAPEIQVKKTWDLDIHGTDWYLDGRHEYTTGWDVSIETIAANDGLLPIDFYDWFTLSPDFKKKEEFFGQIICWNEAIEY